MVVIELRFKDDCPDGEAESKLLDVFVLSM